MSNRQKSRKNYEEEEELDNDDGDYSSLRNSKVAKSKNEDDEDYNVEIMMENKRRKVSSSLSASSQPDEEDEEEGDNGDDYNHDNDSDEDLSELETGQIMKVYVQDFMCHNKLTVDFGRHVNFVTGANGSGKSAIVAAIQLCLGATAGHTGRGTKLEGLIREGSDGPAIMRVTLLNEGPDAYKQEDYGNRIIVERKLVKGGNGGYKLLSKDGKTISVARRELDRILMTFNIQVQNPCCVLTQEESKKFIQGHETEKYEFFLKATGLAMTKSELDKAKININSTELAVEKGEKSLIGKKKAHSDLKNELGQLQQLDEHDERIQQFHAWIHWFAVYAKDDVIMELQKQFELEEQVLNRAQKELSRVEGEVAASGNKEEIKKKIEAIYVDLEDAMADIDNKNSIAKEKSLEVSAVQRDLRSITGGKAENNSRLSSVKKEISDLRARALENAADNERLILENIDKCDKLIEAQKGEEFAFRNEKNIFTHKLDELKKEAFQWDSETRNAEIQIRNAEAEFKRCSDTSQGRASVFGPKIPEILRAIKSHRFKGEVFGPLGDYIKIKDGHGRWGEALEKSLFKIFSSFIVSSADDQRTLMAIFKSLGCQHNAICQTQCPRYNVPAIEGALSICDAIIVDSDLVFNCIIDQAKIDQTIMVADEDDAKKHFGFHNGLNGFRDPRVKNAITARGTRVEFRMGNQGSLLNSAPFRRLLVTDTAELLVGLTERITERKVVLGEAKEHQKESYGQLNQLQNQMKRNDEELRVIVTKIRQQYKRKGDLESEMAEIEAAGMIDTTDLEKEEDELKDALNELLVSEVEKNALMNEVATEHRRFKLDVTEAEMRKLAFEKDFKKESSKLEKLLEADDANKRDVARARRDVAAKVETLADVERNQRDQRIERQQNLDIANAKTSDLIKNWDGNPMEVDPKWTSKQKLENEIVRLIKLKERDKEKIGLGGRSREWVSSQLDKAKDSLTSAKENQQMIKVEWEDQKKDFRKRNKLWKFRLKSNETIIRKHFDLYLQKKGFAGTVEFDHELRLLKLICQTDCENETTRAKDVRQLSGGERSYTTLCLLLALGHVIEFPFRLMDEYDVYLDEVSRKVTLEELQKHALQPQQRGRQFLIITPNNLNDVVTSKDVRVKRMAAPTRNSAHGLQQQTID